MNQNNLDQIYQDVLAKIGEKKYYSAVEEASGLIALARLSDDQKHLLLGKYLLGIAYYHLYNYQSSIEKYMELTNLVLNENLDLDSLQIKPGFLDHVRYGLALVMFHLGDLDGGAIVLGHIIDNSLNLSMVLDSILLLGVIYLMMYDISNDLNFLVITLEMYVSLLEEAPLSRPKKAMLHNNLAILFRYQGEYQKAQEMLNNSFLQNTSPIELVSIFNEMARIHLDLKNLDKARKNLEKASEYMRECSDDLEEARHLLLWGLLKKEEERYLEAQPFMEKSLYLARKCNCRIEQIKVCRELATLYEKMGLVGDSEYFLVYKELKASTNPVKEVVRWQELWQQIKDRVILSPSLK